VNDAQVLSGPDELRKAVLESVLQWHFTREVAGTTRVIQIAFEGAKPGETHPVPGGLLGPTAVPPDWNHAGGAALRNCGRRSARAKPHHEHPGRGAFGAGHHGTVGQSAGARGRRMERGCYAKGEPGIEGIRRAPDRPDVEDVQSASGNTEVFLRIAAVNAQTFHRQERRDVSRSAAM